MNAREIAELAMETMWDKESFIKNNGSNEWDNELEEFTLKLVSQLPDGEPMVRTAPDATGPAPVSNPQREVRLALLAIQRKVIDPIKASRGQRGAYASLPTILPMCRELAANEGCFLTRDTEIVEGKHYCTLSLIHAESGGMVTVRMPYPNQSIKDAQMAGGLHTYSTRYLLAQMFSFAPMKEEEFNEIIGDGDYSRRARETQGFTKPASDADEKRVAMVEAWVQETLSSDEGYPQGGEVDLMNSFLHRRNFPAFLGLDDGRFENFVLRFLAKEDTQAQFRVHAKKELEPVQEAMNEALNS